MLNSTEREAQLLEQIDWLTRERYFWKSRAESLWFRLDKIIMVDSSPVTKEKSNG